MLPGYDPQSMYGVPVAADGFIKIPAPNMSPTVTDRPGIFATGTASSPMDIVDSIMTAGAAASEAVAYLQAHRSVATEPISVEAEMESSSLGRRELVHA
jgi:heterodisulfide reductase subunit A-like polyferredoxin